MRPPTILLCATILLMGSRLGLAQELTIQQDDLVLGLGRSDGIASVELVRGERAVGAGEYIDNAWNAPFVQAIEFDNFAGVSHNPQGNLLGVNYGPNDGSGEIYNLATTIYGVTSQLIGDTTGLGGGGLTLSNLGGLSVSPNNSKIAVTGYDSGAVIVFNYVAGDTQGTGASLSNGREAVGAIPKFATQGTTWRGDNEIMAFATNGDLISVNATSLHKTVLANYPTGGGPDSGRSEFTDVEYNPLISPLLFASYGAFDSASSETINKLFVLDPRNSFALVKTLDNSLSMDTAREIAIDSQGNLFASEFSANVEWIGNVLDPTTLSDNETEDWYIPFERASFNGIDIAVGVLMPDGGVPGDYDADGELTAADINTLSAQILAGANDAIFDLNGDQVVNAEDRRAWVVELKNTFFGDSNLDLQFGTGDLVAVFQAGEYEDSTSGNSGWEEGDWNGDGDFNTSDLVFAFQEGDFEEGPRAAVASVPEPTSGLLPLIASLGLFAMRRRP